MGRIHHFVKPLSALAVTGLVLAGCGRNDQNQRAEKDEAPVSEGTGYGTPGTAGGAPATDTYGSGSGTGGVGVGATGSASGTYGTHSSETSSSSGAIGTGTVSGSGTGVGGSVDTAFRSERTDTQGLGTGFPGLPGFGGTRLDTAGPAMREDTSIGTGTFDTSRSGTGGSGSLPGDTASLDDTSSTGMPGASGAGSSSPSGTGTSGGALPGPSGASGGP